MGITVSAADIIRKKSQALIITGNTLGMCLLAVGKQPAGQACALRERERENKGKRGRITKGRGEKH